MGPERRYIFADVPVTITVQYAHTPRMCKEYETEAADFVPQIRVKVTDEDIKYEQQIAEGVYRRGYLESLAVYRKLCNEMIEFDTFLFHCSAVAVDGNAYLFTAPSGTGKSTHVRLWKERFGERAVIINDDKPLLQVRNEAIYVCGMPWSGKHCLNSNQKAPIKGICLLVQGTDNQIEELSPIDGYPGLYRQTYMPPQRDKMIKTLKLLKQVVERVPLYRLSCDISQEAVTASWEAMHV